MRILMALVVVACSSSGETTPDAPPAGVHDQLVSEDCDSSWGPDVTDCEHACLVQPVITPCVDGNGECNDTGKCNDAKTRRGPAVDCESTFVVYDHEGQHRGCCQIRTSTVDSKLMIPTFYECP